MVLQIYNENCIKVVDEYWSSSFFTMWMLMSMLALLMKASHLLQQHGQEDTGIENIILINTDDLAIVLEEFVRQMKNSFKVSE